MLNKTYNLYKLASFIPKIHDIIRLYEIEGKNSVEISKLYNCSPKDIRKILLDNGVKLRNKTKKEGES